MKKLFFLTALLCASLMANAYTTDQDTWIGGGGENDKFKWYESTDVTPPTDVINIQKPGWSEEIGIYTHKSGYNKVTFNGEVKTNGVHYHQDGAGVILFLSALTDKNTDVLFYDGDNVAWGLRIYNDNGEEDTGDKKVSSLAINVTDTTLDASISETCQITATTAAGYDGTITYASNKSGIATVSSTGLVTAIGRGTATITVTAPATTKYKSSSQTLTVTVTGPINWNAIDWVGNGSGNNDYTNKFKVSLPNNVSVVNIQSSFGTEAGIYLTFPDGVSACDFGDGNYAIQGAGMLLYVSKFTKKVTTVNVTAVNEYEVLVYYEDGSDSATAITNTEVEAKAVKVIENGQLVIIKNGVKYNAIGTQL